MHTVEVRELNRSAHLHNQHSTPYQQAKRAWNNRSGREVRRVQKQPIEEEDKLGRDCAQLAFVEGRAETCRAPADRQRRLMDSFAPGSDDWVQAERLLVNFESPARFVESFCHRMRRRVNDHPLRERPEPY
ncbi:MULTISPECIES: hypothetical protein [unclassified Bradyrhizobium]|jgi:hypothetical protein|uniref:hypothetical protein n=1 Tax=unclassified Bradyrhizobium TaxID=2631580 RepID=UPI0010460FD7|nr:MULTISPECIES: hypothetical protein [unclassified Bradyrhizobium]